MNIMVKAVSAVILTTAFVAGTASAAGNIRVGQMEIHPYVSLKEIFDDNIYSTPVEQKASSCSCPSACTGSRRNITSSTAGTPSTTAKTRRTIT